PRPRWRAASRHGRRRRGARAGGRPGAAGRAWRVNADPRQSGEMPFLQHLEELRRVLLQSLIGVALGAALGWWAAPRVMEDIIRRTVKQVIVLSPLDAFNERFKLSLVIG